jgi:hypothetical protein
MTLLTNERPSGAIGACSPDGVNQSECYRERQHHLGLVSSGGQVLPKCGASPTRASITVSTCVPQLSRYCLSIVIKFPKSNFSSHHDDYCIVLRRRGAQRSPIRHTPACLKFTSRHRCHVRHACLMTQYLNIIWEIDVISHRCPSWVCELQFPVSSLFSDLGVFRLLCYYRHSIHSPSHHQSANRG